jgi:hypothetical protein
MDVDGGENVLKDLFQRIEFSYSPLIVPRLFFSFHFRVFCLSPSFASLSAFGLWSFT